MQAVVKPASTGPCVARKPAPPAPTTTTSNVWSMNLYSSARVEFMLFLDWLGLDADLHAVSDIARRPKGRLLLSFAESSLPVKILTKCTDAARLKYAGRAPAEFEDRKSTRLNSSHLGISYAVFCLKK